MCVGKALAYQKMRIVICMLVRAFDMKFAPGYDPSEWEDNLRDFLATSTGKLPVVLTPRGLQPEPSVCV